MVFKHECEQFLDRLTSVRQAEIDKAIQVALQEEYTPFETKLLGETETAIARETEKKNALIAQIEADYAKFVATMRADATKELAKKKAEVELRAKQRSTEHIDRFILGVSKLADETKI